LRYVERRSGSGFILSTRLLEGPAITRELFRSMLREETARIINEIGSRAYHLSKYKDAEDLLDKLTTSQNFPSS